MHALCNAHALNLKVHALTNAHNSYFHSSPSATSHVFAQKSLYNEGYKHHFMVYQNQFDEQWHCAWCNYTAKEFNRVVDHENDVHV